MTYKFGDRVKYAGHDAIVLGVWRDRNLIEIEVAYEDGLNKDDMRYWKTAMCDESDLTRAHLRDEGLVRAAWIPCSERLPDMEDVSSVCFQSKYVLVYCALLNRAEEYRVRRGFAVKLKASGELEWRGDEVYAVTHWQPLPAPPLNPTQEP